MAPWASLIRVVIAEDFREDKLKKNLKQINTKTIGGSNVLHFAVVGGNVRTINFIIHSFLEKGLNIDSSNTYGETPLHWACKEGTPQIVELLLKYGADPSVVDGEGSTPLHWAVDYDLIEIAQVLINHGANTNARNHDNLTPLLVSIQNESINCIELLGGTPLPPQSPIQTKKEKRKVKKQQSTESLLSTLRTLFRVQ